MMDLYPSLMTHVYPLWMNLGRTYRSYANISCICTLFIDARSEMVDGDYPRFIRKIRGQLSSSVDTGQRETKIK